MANKLNALFSALSDPTRMSIVEQLAGGSATVKELAHPHDIALPTFLRHLKVLEDAGVVTSVKKGRVRTCHINTSTLIEAQGWLAWQRAVWEGRDDSAASGI